jgi:hypothetical protein
VRGCKGSGGKRALACAQRRTRTSEGAAAVAADDTVGVAVHEQASRSWAELQCAAGHLSRSGRGQGWGPRRTLQTQSCHKLQSLGSRSAGQKGGTSNMTESCMRAIHGHAVRHGCSS